MITTPTPKNHKTFLLLFFFLLTFTGNAQIGIGTVTPNASSILDISSTTQGMLAPRMTTAQRNAIASPADGLMVYDTDLKTFYFYVSTTTSWTPVNSTASRLNFKRIKSTDVLATVLAAELAAGGGSKYILDSNTVYEINGLITFNFPIDLNNAYVEGLDANGDIIRRTTGNIFEGTTGGTIKNVTLIATAGLVFNLTASSNAQNFLLRDTIIANSNTVGTLSGFGLVFISIVQFSGNANGLTYNNIDSLLLSNLAWFGNNTGTFEKLTGTFTQVQKQGGFSSVNGTAIGFDVSTSGLTVTDGDLETVVFTGTNTTGYVKPYTTGTYTGYSFTNNWTARSTGIPTESDTNATGDFSMDYPVGSGLGVTFNSSNPSNIVKVGSGTPSTTYSNLFRFSTDPSVNRIKYVGKKKRIFLITGSISFQVPAAGTYIIYIYKNGTALSQYKIYGRGAAVNDIVVLPLNATAELTTNDYIEVFAQRYSGSNGDIVVPNMTLTLK
ncbi:MAG: hypothetical protein ABI576_03495 [Flavobacterium sp.]